MKTELKIYGGGLVDSNSYVLINQNRQAVLIDAGNTYAFYKEMEKKDNFKIEYVLFTHGHFDHIAAGAQLKSSGVKCGISAKDASFLHTKGSLAVYAGVKLAPFEADFVFVDNDVLHLCGTDIKVITTPGHTAGSVCFLYEDMLFSGDTLFAGEIGRTDFPTGSYKEIIQSIKQKLFALDENVTVYPGHGEKTSIGQEKNIIRTRAAHEPYHKRGVCKS